MKKNRQPKRILITIFVEGETEMEFYTKLVDYIKKQKGYRFHCEIEYKNLKGIGEFKRKLANYFKNKICVDYKDYRHKVALCYDTDVFKDTSLKTADWEIVERKLYKYGADEIVHIRADRSIEDWFWLDLEGLRKYLKLPKDYRFKKRSGYKNFVKLFDKAGKSYKKGKKCAGLINALSMETILVNIAEDVEPLLKILD